MAGKEEYLKLFLMIVIESALDIVLQMPSQAGVAFLRSGVLDILAPKT